MVPCSLCEGIQGITPVSLVHADGLAWAFMTLAPINPGHTLVVPTAHVGYIHEMDDSTGMHVFRTAMRVSQAIRESTVRCDDIALFIADGPAASQKVPHVHIHVIPRVAGDGFHLNPEGGVSHPENVASREELDAAAARVRLAYERLWGATSS